MIENKMNKSCSTYKVTEVFPIGAFSRKSRAMGLIHITRMTSGDRKLMCKRILKSNTSCWGISNQTFNIFINVILSFLFMFNSYITQYWAYYWMIGRSAFIWTASRWVWANRSPGNARRAPMKAQMTASPNFTDSLVKGTLLKYYLCFNDKTI